MGLEFGHLWKYRGIITYKISPYEIKVFRGFISHGLPNMVRRILENVPYIGPPTIISYIVYDQAEKEHHRLMLKNPKDYENDV